MSLHDDLLSQASHLAKWDKNKPRQASLRRAISTAYYALYHLITSNSAYLLTPKKPSKLHAQVQRSFAHAEMKAVCKQFAQGNVQALSPAVARLITPPISSQLQSIALLFVEMQEARHSADYDTLETFNRFDVVNKIQKVKNAFVDWAAIQGHPNTNVFVAALMHNRSWNK